MRSWAKTPTIEVLFVASLSYISRFFLPSSAAELSLILMIIWSWKSNGPSKSFLACHSLLLFLFANSFSLAKTSLDGTCLSLRNALKAMMNKFSPNRALLLSSGPWSWAIESLQQQASQCLAHAIKHLLTAPTFGCIMAYDVMWCDPIRSVAWCLWFMMNICVHVSVVMNDPFDHSL